MRCPRALISQPGPAQQQVPPIDRDRRAAQGRQRCHPVLDAEAVRTTGNRRRFRADRLDEDGPPVRDSPSGAAVLHVPAGGLVCEVREQR